MFGKGLRRAGAYALIFGTLTYGSFEAGRHIENRRQEPDIHVSSQDFDLRLTLSDKGVIDLYGREDAEKLVRQYGYSIFGDLYAFDLKHVFNRINDTTFQAKAIILKSMMDGELHNKIPKEDSIPPESLPIPEGGKHEKNIEL